MSKNRCGRVVTIALIVASAACSSGGSSKSSSDPSPSTSPSPTTVPASVAAVAYTKRGPYPVGVTTLQLEGGVNVEVWYPAVAGTHGVVTYDVRDRVPPAVKGLLTADIPATHSISGA